MSYRLPEPGEVWPHQHLPSVMSAEIIERDQTTGMVTFDARTEIGDNIKTSRRQSAVTVFVHQYRPPADLPFDPPPADMFGVPL